MLNSNPTWWHGDNCCSAPCITAQVYTFFGRHFTLITDHKLLLMVLEPKDQIASVSGSHLYCWSLALTVYDFSIEFIWINTSTGECWLLYLSHCPFPATSDLSLFADDLANSVKSLFSMSCLSHHWNIKTFLERQLRTLCWLKSCTTYNQAGQIVLITRNYIRVSLIVTNLPYRMDV